MIEAFGFNPEYGNNVIYKALCANFIMQKSILLLIGNQLSKITTIELLQRPFTKEQVTFNDFCSHIREFCDV